MIGLENQSSAWTSPDGVWYSIGSIGKTGGNLARGIQCLYSAAERVSTLVRWGQIRLRVMSGVSMCRLR